jgi:hypothetical protein
MGTVTYKKGSKAPHQNVDTSQQIGKDKYVPKSAGGKDATPGHPSGKTSYPSTNRNVSFSTDKHHANRRAPYAKGGPDKQVSFTSPKKRMGFGTEKHVGKDKFRCHDKNPTYGTGGV